MGADSLIVTGNPVPPRASGPGDSSGLPPVPSMSDVSRVFHRLNNQLGVILANAELLESRLPDDAQRARAGQVVAGALEAIGAVQDLRRLIGPSDR